MGLTVGELLDYLSGVARSTPVVIEGPMPGDATLFVDELIVGHGERGNDDEIVIIWDLEDAHLVNP
jgi:hypothetical protein